MNVCIICSFMCAYACTHTHSHIPIPYFLLLCFRSHQMYYMFGFLFLVFIILLVTCSEATILLCYFHLCAEDYHWWWRSFLTSGFTAIYFFFYCIHYYVSKLEIEGITSTLLYFGYTFIMVFLFFLLAGKCCDLFLMFNLIFTRVFYFLIYQNLMYNFIYLNRCFSCSSVIEKLTIFSHTISGTIGFFSCFWFVTKIYSVVKVD